MTRGALNSRRMTASSTTVPVSVPTTSATTSAGQYGQPCLPTMIASSAAAGTPEVADREVDDPARPVDEHDAHRDERDDQAADDADEQQVPRDDRLSASHQPPSVPKNTARARSSRSSSSCGGALEPHLALLEEDRPVGDRERDVERLLDDEHRLAARLQLVDELEQALHDDRREAERQLVDQQDLGLVDQHAAEREHLLLAARQAASPICLRRSASSGNSSSTSSTRCVDLALRLAR